MHNFLSQNVDEFELPYGSYSLPDIQDYIVYIIKKHETLLTNSPINIHINRINNRLFFKINYGHKLELKIAEIMKIGSPKKLIDKITNGGNVLSLEVFEVVLISTKSEVLHTFKPNKSCAYVLNVKPSNIAFMNTYSTFVS